ncbi:MAG: hypothetical protein Q9197_004726 [Variospora fuerteventurae]
MSTNLPKISKGSFCQTGNAAFREPWAMSGEAGPLLPHNPTTNPLQSENQASRAMLPQPSVQSQNPEPRNTMCRPRASNLGQPTASIFGGAGPSKWPYNPALENSLEIPKTSALVVAGVGGISHSNTAAQLGNSIGVAGTWPQKRVPEPLEGETSLGHASKLPATKEADATCASDRMLDQVEKLATIYKSVPARFQKALSKLIDLKVELLRSQLADGQMYEDDGILEELNRTSKVKCKLEECGVVCQGIDSLIEWKIRSLLIINQLNDTLSDLGT